MYLFYFTDLLISFLIFLQQVNPVYGVEKMWTHSYSGVNENLTSLTLI